MVEQFGPTTIWAMHPVYLARFLQRHTIEAMLPEGLKALGALAGGQEAKAPADPIRDGATVIVPVEGTLSPKGSYGGTSTEKLADRIREFGADPKVGTIVLRMGTPGGYVYGTPECADAIFETRALKPIVAVATPFCFSAGHWLASQCSAYFASSSADVGSVGVRSGHTDMSGLEDKIGIKTTLVASDPDKIAGHPYAPLSDEDRADMQAEIDETNRLFIAHIARGRGIRPSEVPAIHGKGKIFSAAKAAEAGAIDGVMTLRDVVAKYSSSRSRLGLMRQRAELLGRLADI